MSWRILYIEESDCLSLHLDNVKVKKATNEFMFPLSDITMILIDNCKLTLTINLLLACSKNNIPIICCGDNHHPANLTVPLFGHFEATKILYDQIKWNQKEKDILWKEIVKKKLINQKYVLSKIEANSEAIELISKYIEEVMDGDVTNREGLGAKVYFRALFGNSFSRRDENTINACLNYGYSIFRAMISKTLVAKGLNPQLGLFHKGPSNYFNLSDDLLEIFRPIVDLYVYNHFLNEKIFIREHRLSLLSLINGKLLINGQNQTINHCIEKIVDDIIHYFNNGNVSYFTSFEPVLYDL